MLPIKLQNKIDQRLATNSVRELGAPNNLIDFSSNDYLGFSTTESIYTRTSEILKQHNLEANGATGSRLLTGNHALYQKAEQHIAKFHNAEGALIFNSGYDANLGFFGCVPQRGDIIFYDELCHASIRDGIRASNAKAYKFKHNDTRDLENQLATRTQSRTSDEVHYVVTESVFSMDGDQPDLKAIIAVSKKYKGHLIVDEAHALGVVGEGGGGLVQKLGLESDVFARLVTFGKALGCHGAAILCSIDMKQYLLNFARSFMYTTALPPHAVATILSAYENLQKNKDVVRVLTQKINYFKAQLISNSVQDEFISSDSSIQSCLIEGNTKVKRISNALHEHGFDIKPILSPTVALGQERLRICIHTYNTEEDIKSLVKILAQQLNITPKETKTN